MGIPITDTCAGCGGMLVSFWQRLGCRPCFDQGKLTPTMCKTCLVNHRAIVHPELDPIPEDAFPGPPNPIHRA